MNRTDTSSDPGLVSLVGAGPGDPELITVKGLRRLREASVVLYDRLAPMVLVEEAGEARKINVGKKPGDQRASQDDINRWMIALSRKQYRVVRLKGGDPCVFGRGGEESEALARAGIPFEIIPGVTSAVGVPTAAGIPLTHREMAGSVAILTGHRQPDPAQKLRWKELAGGADTIVLLMSVGNLERNLGWIQQAGRDPGTPAAAIEQGTTPEQRIITGTLSTLAEKVEQRRLRPPAIILVGPVVSLADQIPVRHHGNGGVRGTSLDSMVHS